MYVFVSIKKREDTHGNAMGFNESVLSSSFYLCITLVYLVVGSI